MDEFYEEMVTKKKAGQLPHIGPLPVYDINDLKAIIARVPDNSCKTDSK